jgi:TPR repeat protein
MKVLLWLISLLALATAILLAVAAITAPGASQYGQAALKEMRLVGLGAAACALLFALAANPLSGRFLPVLLRWVISLLALVAGAACIVFILYAANRAIINIQYEIQAESDGREQTAAVAQVADSLVGLFDEPYWDGRVAMTWAFEDLGNHGMYKREAAAGSACDFLGLVDDNRLLTALQENPDFAGNAPGYRTNMADIASRMYDLPSNTRVMMILAAAFNQCPGPGTEPLMALSFAEEGAKDGDPAASILLADMIFENAGDNTDPERAMELYRSAAAAGAPVAQYRISQRGEPEEAETNLFAAADAGSTEAMSDASNALFDGRFGRKDPDRAQEYLNKYCAETDCYSESLSLLVEDSPPPEAAQRAARLREVLCRAQANGEACLDAGLMYYKGDRIAQNNAKAMTLFGEGCRLDDARSCFNAALIHELGQGVDQDLVKAGQIYRQACKLGFQDACAAADELGAP